MRALGASSLGSLQPPVMRTKLFAQDPQRESKYPMTVERVRLILLKIASEDGGQDDVVIPRAQLMQMLTRLFHSLFPSPKFPSWPLASLLLLPPRPSLVFVLPHPPLLGRAMWSWPRPSHCANRAPPSKQKPLFQTVSIYSPWPWLWGMERYNFPLSWRLFSISFDISKYKCYFSPSPKSLNMNSVSRMPRQKTMVREARLEN